MPQTSTKDPIQPPSSTHRGDPELPSGPGEFTTQMVHLYRGEMARSNAWRTRLDATTNWAVVTTGAVLTFTFSAPTHPHVVLLFSFLMVWLFLVIEARRYRYYELSALRLRLIETEFFVGSIGAPVDLRQEWGARLVDSLLTPRFPITFWEAIGRRLRRNYIWLFLILGISWLVKLIVYSPPPHSFSSFLQQASLGALPGQVVVLSVSVFFGAILLLALFTVGLRASPGEVLSDRDVLEYPSDLLTKLARATRDVVHRHEQLAIIITDRPSEVSQHLLTLLKRGVTGLEGRGMYTGQQRHVLFCVVRPAEIPRVKSAVHSADEKAFVVINPTERIWGGGFEELGPRWQGKRQREESGEEASTRAME